MSAPTKPDGAFSDGLLSLADAIGATLRLAGAHRQHDAFARALASYRHAAAGQRGREYPADARAQAAITLAQALGVEMTMEQRQRFNSRGFARSEEITMLIDGLRAAGFVEMEAGRYADQQFGLEDGLALQLRRELHTVAGAHFLEADAARKHDFSA